MSICRFSSLCCRFTLRCYPRQFLCFLAKWQSVVSNTQYPSGTHESELHLSCGEGIGSGCQSAMVIQFTHISVPVVLETVTVRSVCLAGSILAKRTRFIALASDMNSQWPSDCQRFMVLFTRGSPKHRALRLTAQIVVKTDQLKNLEIVLQLLKLV